MSLVRNLSVLMALPLIAVVSGEQLPPVYFNHIPMFVDQAILDDLMASRFLQEEFSTFQKRTTQRDGGKWSYTGVYAFGQGTYLEFLPGAHGGEPLKQGMAPLGTVEFGMWMDERDQLPSFGIALPSERLESPKFASKQFFRMATI